MITAITASAPAIPIPRPSFDSGVAAHFARATRLALVLVDATGTIRFVNPAAAQLFGYLLEEMVGQPVELIIPDRFRSAHAKGFERAVAGEKLNLGGKPVEVYATRKNGGEFPIELTLCTWHDGDAMGAGAVIRDITERKEREARLLRQASQDVLTGLPNRNRCTEHLVSVLERNRDAAVLLLDIDGFGDINDVHGHAVGDSLLQAVAVRLPHALPDAAIVARLGGDEFAVLMPDMADANAAAGIADIILASCLTPFEVSGQVLNIGFSIGVALAPEHGADPEALLASADFAMHKARAGGGRSYCVYESAMRDEAASRRALRDELFLALKHGELVLHYQPQVHIETGKVFGVEALIRWNHPVRGLLPPGAFLPALEQSGIALEIGWWTLDEACRATAAMLAAGHRGVKMGVNLFPGQLHSPNLNRKVAEALAKHQLAPTLLELEVTETTALRDDDRSLNAMSGLRDVGVGIAFDDFGTGYASLSSLQRYPLTTLKIDRSFICDIPDKPRDAAITRALVAMSYELGLETIAEGVETAEQERVVLSLGCTSAQGYRYGKAMPLDGLLNFLSGDRSNNRTA